MQVNATVALEVIQSCPKCGMAFGAPVLFIAERRRDHGDFYCPAGHVMTFPQESDVERLQRRLRWSEQAEMERRRQLTLTEASLRATKGVVTKLRKRAASGLCPCCSRSFTNLRRHMASKHPDFAEVAE